MVLAVAMSHGVPVVRFDCPVGPREVVTDGHDGLLVPLGDIAGLAAALNRLVEDPALRRDLGGNAAVSARRYSAEVIGPQWEALFTDLLRAKQGAGAALPA
jgi:glycosyltransferase involved in cell wall biosynthesis